MERRGSVNAQSLEMVRRGVSFVARESVLRIDRVPFFHASVAVRFGEDGSGGDGNAARVAFDKRFLLDQHIKFHGVDEEIVGRNRELLKGGGHGLAGGLINVPGVNALRVDFGDGPGEGVLANAFAEFRAAFGGQFLGVVETDNSAFGVENHCGGNHGAKQRTASGLINAGDARPTQPARRSLETGRAETVHRVGILARCRSVVERHFS